MQSRLSKAVPLELVCSAGSMYSMAEQIMNWTKPCVL